MAIILDMIYKMSRMVYEKDAKQAWASIQEKDKGFCLPCRQALVGGTRKDGKEVSWITHKEERIFVSFQRGSFWVHLQWLKK